MAKTKKQPIPLKGCVVTFCGNFYGRNQTALLAYAASLGAHTAKSVTRNVTHLVATQTECDKLSSKVKQAQDQGVYIVSIDWMDESETAGSKQPESNYALLNTNPGPIIPAAPASSTPSANDHLSNATKRQSTPFDSLAPLSKKYKLGEVNEKARPLGESQLAKDSSRIQLDEGLGAPYSVYFDADGVIWDATLK